MVKYSESERVQLSVSGGPEKELQLTAQQLTDRCDVTVVLVKVPGRSQLLSISIPQLVSGGPGFMQGDANTRINERIAVQTGPRDCSQITLDDGDLCCFELAD